jgi:N-acetylglucosaminyldiphosphoundecaprenol N-acetyl-beta-D-mannosaminyltransferase
MDEIEIFGIKIHPLTQSAFLSIIQSNLENGGLIVQNGVNAATVVELIDNSVLRQAISNSDLINIDGISVLLALRFLGYKVAERVPCPDLAEKVLELANSNNYSVFLLGAKEADLLLCRKNLHERYPNLVIAGHRNGYFNNMEEKEVVNFINSTNPDILLLGMPSPKKELFIENSKNLLRAKYCLGVGGFFDVLSGSKKRAPILIQKIGMEWIFRFVQEPHRMWRRYIIGNVRFVWLVLKVKMNIV